MRLTIALAISTLALGTALAATPGFAQSSENGGTNGCIRFQLNCSNKPYSATEPTAQAAAQNRYNGQQRAQRTGSAANTERGQARSAALGARGAEYASGGGGPYYNYAEGNNFAGGSYYDQAPGPAFAEGPTDSAVAACAARFRSYDPATGTYLGFDGMRHSCP